MIDIVGFLDVLKETEADFNHIFHVTEKVQKPIQTLENPNVEKTDTRQKLKKAQKKYRKKNLQTTLN